MESQKLVNIIPPMSDPKDLSQIAYAKDFNPVYVIDLPRSSVENMGHKNLSGLFIGIEKLKDGKVHDQRYESKEKSFDNPLVIIFTNSILDTKYLSGDRWQIYAVDVRNKEDSIPCLV